MCGMGSPGVAGDPDLRLLDSFFGDTEDNRLDPVSSSVTVVVVPK